MSRQDFVRDVCDDDSLDIQSYLHGEVLGVFCLDPVKHQRFGILGLPNTHHL